MLQSGPLFQPEETLSPGLKRYYSQIAKKKIASSNALSKRVKAIKPNDLQLTSYLTTGIILINNTANELNKIYNIPGSEIILLAALGTPQYGWAVIRNGIFYFAGGKGQASRMQHLQEMELIYFTGSGRKKVLNLTEKGRAIVDHFAVELSSKVERLGIIKG